MSTLPLGRTASARPVRTSPPAEVSTESGRSECSRWVRFCLPCLVRRLPVRFGLLRLAPERLLRFEPRLLRLLSPCWSCWLPRPLPLRLFFAFLAFFGRRWFSRCGCSSCCERRRVLRGEPLLVVALSFVFILFIVAARLGLGGTVGGCWACRWWPPGG